MAEKPEALLDYSDWMGIPIQGYPVTLDRFKSLLLEQAKKMDMVSKERVSSIVRGGRWRQYTLSSFLGATQGCLGAFMDVSLYVHGMLPLLSYGIKDSVIIKLLNLVFGLVIRDIFFAFDF